MIAPEWDGYSRRAQYYAVEYQTNVDRPLLEGHVTSDVASILEIPCGAGRNLAWLAGTGRFVLCADIEPAMIDVVEEEIGALGVGDRVRARVADMRILELGQTFDLVLVPQEAMQLLAGPDDVARALRALAGSLAPGGTLVVDLFDFRAGGRAATSTLPDYYDPGRPDGVGIMDWTREADGGLHMTRVRRQRPEPPVMHIDYSYEVRDGNQQVDAWCSTIALHSYTQAEVTELAGRAGLRVERVLGDYEANEAPPSAPRMIFVLRGAR